MRPAPSVATVLALALVLAACTKGDPVQEPSGPAVEPPASATAAALVLPDVDALLAAPVHWESGILEVFDDLAVIVPEIAELRDEFVAEEERYREELFGDLESLEALALPGAPFGPSLPRGGGGGQVAAAAPGIDAGLGANFMVGATVPEMINSTFVTEGGTPFSEIPVGETRSAGGQSVTKTDERNSTIEMSAEHKEVKDRTIVTTKYKLKVEGTMCPAEDGEFDVTITVEQFVTSTTDTGEAWEHQTLVANTKGRLGENAIPERYDVETMQSTVVRHPSGEMATTTSTKQRSDLNFREMEKSAPNVVGQSGELSQAEMDKITKQGDDRAMALAVGQMFGLFKHWLMGGCVQIKHDAPGKVDAESTTDIKVETKHRAAGAEVRSKVTLKLSGDKSVDPTEFTSTGSFQFTAGEPDSKATITINATSRQGGDEQKVTINVKGGAYIAIGGGDGYQITEKDHVVVCDLDEFGIWLPGRTSATDQVHWVFFSEPVDGYTATFGDIKGNHMKGRGGSWELHTGENGQPSAITATYSEGFDIKNAGTQSQDAKELHGGSAHFDLKAIARPKECDAKG